MEDIATYVPLLQGLAQGFLTGLGVVIAAFIAKQGIDEYQKQKRADNKSYQEQREIDRKSDLNKQKAEEYERYIRAFWRSNELANKLTSTDWR